MKKLISSIKAFLFDPPEVVDWDVYARATVSRRVGRVSASSRQGAEQEAHSAGLVHLNLCSPCQREFRISDIEVYNIEEVKKK